MATIEIQWTIQVTETYHAVIDYEEFAEMVRASGQEPPALEDLTPGQMLDNDLIDVDELAGLEDSDKHEDSVNERDLDSIEVLPA